MRVVSSLEGWDGNELREKWLRVEFFQDGIGVREERMEAERTSQSGAVGAGGVRGRGRSKSRESRRKEVDC